MITLHDTFNGNQISSHRTLENAVKAQRKHLAAIQRRYGRNSYLTYKFLEDGEPVAPGEVVAVQQALDCGGAQ